MAWADITAYVTDSNVSYNSSGHYLTKSSGTGYASAEAKSDEGTYATMTRIRGSFSTAQSPSNYRGAFGLSNDSITGDSGSYERLDYGFRMVGSTSEVKVSKGDGTTYTDYFTITGFTLGDYLEVEDDGSDILMKHNGSTVYTFTGESLPSNTQFYCMLYDANFSIQKMEYNSGSSGGGSGGGSGGSSDDTNATGMYEPPIQIFRRMNF